MTAEHEPRRVAGTRSRLSDDLGTWIRELDACDGYLVILGRPLDEQHHRIFGPYADRDALTVADELSAASDDEVSIVRFHVPRPAGPPIPRPRSAE